jgi:[glutamine synthetase] adenylyltransferase / [glutamine synthetase]-adenylyl-L-tyrosine phosphorylase
MNPTENIAELVKNLPDAESAARFFAQFSERNPADARKLFKNKGLLSDVLTLAAFSPLLATTLQQTPQYAAWLARQRKEAKIRDKEELLESLARFSLTNSQIEAPVLLARFRRRELLRIYLRDIRRLGTIAEITEEISHLADAVLEHALRLARQEMNNRYGIPLESDAKGKAKPARFCIVALGKLGSNELNYASDIDLLFLYSADGATSGQGSRGAVSNREYFVKLAEFVVKIVGGQSGEGAAYRVDVRLRPHGRVGALAVSAAEAVKYYNAQAQAWERQTLIRSRAAAGDAEIFRAFFQAVEDAVFSKDETIENALRNVRLSKDKINLEHGGGRGFNVKLGAGGIREIEFIAQALQLAYGGRDRWLRAPHTLISLARLADRNLISENELNELSDAYEFLRRLEHRLQMEHGLQTHALPVEIEKKNLVARRMNFDSLSEFEARLEHHTNNVSRAFRRVFGAETETEKEFSRDDFVGEIRVAETNFFSADERKCDLPAQIVAALEKIDLPFALSKKKIAALEKFCRVSPHFTEMLAANPLLIGALPSEKDEFPARDYERLLSAAIEKETELARRLAELRKAWSRLYLEIAAFDSFEKLDLRAAKNRLTALAEAAITAAFEIARREIGKHSDSPEELNFAVLGLGKLGGRGMDYGSDLDLILVFDQVQSSRFKVQGSELEPLLGTLNLELGTFYARAAEIFVNALSGFTREGNLYRVDLRLRPDGKNGAICPPREAFLNYLENRSAIWEWLAYVKLRGVGGDSDSARAIETEARRIVHERAKNVSIADLKAETRSVRERLERQRTGGAKDLNIKFSAGGLLDVYFAMRFLQLRDGVFDDAENRSTLFMLEKLRQNNSLSEKDFAAFYHGYEFLNRLDHSLRLIVGRTNQLPRANPAALRTIVERMRLASLDELLERLTLHRLAVRQAFENVLQ